MKFKKTKKTILVVNTGSTKKRFILHRLNKLSLKVIVLHKEKNWAQPYVDDWILADTSDHNESLQAVQVYITEHPEVKIDGVVTFWEDDVLLTSKIVDRFNFTGISYNIARKVRNKYLFREFCSKNNLPVPQFFMVKSPEDLKYVQKNFKFPVVVKPAFGSSSAFVMKIENKNDLPDTLKYVKGNISTNMESAFADGLEIFIEEFIDGDEVDIDVLIQNGKIKFSSISDNYNKNKGMFFVDSGQAIPSSLPERSQKELLDLVEETLEKLGIQNGCIHYEAKYTKKGPIPIEVNMRMGGDYVNSYTKSAWGIDLIDYAVKIAVNEYIKLPEFEEPKKYVIGWDLHPEESGVLVELDIPEDFEKQDFIEDFELSKQIGDPIFVAPE
jgi:biotin carboxylase